MKESNRKKHEINEQIKKNQKLMNYYDSIYRQKNIEFNQLLKKYRNLYAQIKNGNLLLKKGEQLTQANIICMDKYGKREGDNSSFNDIDDGEDHGQISENYEESENNENINDNENENENEEENDDYNEEDEK